MQQSGRSPDQLLSASIRERSALAKGAMYWTLASKSKSNPFKAESPKGRRALEPSCLGQRFPHQLGAVFGIGLRLEAAFAVCGATDGKKNCLALLLAGRDVLARSCQWTWRTASCANETTQSLGQFFSCVPSNTWQSSLLTAKSISGAPPGPLTIISKAMGIT